MSDDYRILALSLASQDEFKASARLDTSSVIDRARRYLGFLAGASDEGEKSPTSEAAGSTSSGVGGAV